MKIHLYKIPWLPGKGWKIYPFIQIVLAIKEMDGGIHSLPLPPSLFSFFSAHSRLVISLTFQLQPQAKGAALQNDMYRFMLEFQCLALHSAALCCAVGLQSGATRCMLQAGVQKQYWERDLASPSPEEGARLLSLVNPKESLPQISSTHSTSGARHSFIAEAGLTFHCVQYKHRGQLFALIF